jgi:hypothetical protein
MKWSLERIEAVAVEHPEDLVAEVACNREPVFLSDVGEALGLIPTRHFDIVVPALVDLLQHEQAFVREGALYGAASFWETSEELRALIHKMAESDPSPAIRETAQDLIKLAV